MAELPEVGARAPDVTFRQGREEFRLLHFVGEKNLVLAFYAAAFTGGWERELVGFQQKLTDFEALDTQIIASSADLYFAQKAFADHCGVTFPVAAGVPLHEMARAFGVYDDERGSDRRVTFVIDKQGIIRHVIDDPRDMARHSQESLDVIKSWE
jgi:mycoredoxin-dependent peroxiredoxin